MENWEHTYICIDLKSFYASVECAERGLDPFSTNLVVADKSRSENTICLAITPAMKKLGIKNRCRIRDIPKSVSYICATPRMKRYMEVSGAILNAYISLVSYEDVHVYSIDECFINATPYLHLYKTNAKQFAKQLIAKAFQASNVTATAGIGENMFLAKVALDIVAKHASDGIGILDAKSFKEKIWFHKPITDIWGIGPGTAKRLAKFGVQDLAGVCAQNPKLLHKEFGKNAEYLIDHAWGLESCTIKQVRNYKPEGHSISAGQVLMRNYTFNEAKTILREMVLGQTLQLVSTRLAASVVGLSVGYSNSGYWNGWGVGSNTGGSKKLKVATNSFKELTNAVLEIFERTTIKDAKIRRLNITFGGLQNISNIQQSLFDEPQSEKENAVSNAMVAIRSRFGNNAMLKATSLKPEANARERNMQVGGHRA